LRESTLARELSRAGRERAREFSWDVVAPRIEAVYERAR
jgi:glycosyltransferase involved in cell wall biosynthesis